MWTQLASFPPGLEARWDFSYADFPPSGDVVVFGGAPVVVGQPWLNDTWRYHIGTNAWSPGPAPPAGLTPRAGAAMTYDAVSQRIVMFGGAQDGVWPPFAETWLYDGTRWTLGPAAPPGLAGRQGAQMVYDSAIRKVVLYGGSGLAAYDDTWLYDGGTNTWSAGPASPSGLGSRASFGMSYDPALRKVVVAGGNGDYDVWYFDGTTWTRGPSMTEEMGNRERVRMAYDPDLGGQVVFGGIGPAFMSQKTFLLKDGAWSKVGFSGLGPSARLDAALVWDPSNADFLVFGGEDNRGNGSTVFTDTWRLDASSSSPEGVHASTSFDSPPPASSGGANPEDPPAPPGKVVGRISAHDGRFWAGGRSVTLRGVDADPIGHGAFLTDHDFARIASWGMNFVRLQLKWSSIEPTAPDRIGGAWVHHFDQAAMDGIIEMIGYAQAHGIRVLVENSCGPPCFGDFWPYWLYTSPYNSHRKNYTDASEANTDYWTDGLQQRFTSDYMTYLAGQLRGVLGVMGYECLNEPAQGTYPNSHATTQRIMDVHLKIATAVRAVDPARTIVFTTRGSEGLGLLTADFSGWVALGNVAFDVHDFFGGRWGTSFNVADETQPGEIEQMMFARTGPHRSTSPYIGTTFGQLHMIRTFTDVLSDVGIPLLVGEFSATPQTEERNVMGLVGTMAYAFNQANVSWAFLEYNGIHGLFDPSGRPYPWVAVLKAAAKQ